MATGSNLVEAIKSYRRLYDQEHQHLSSKDLEKGWKRHWNTICAEVTETASNSYGNNLPQKRTSSEANVGMDSSPKRPGHKDSVAAPALSSQPIQRQASAPAGRASKQASQSAMRPTKLSVSVGPIAIPPRQQNRRASTTAASFSQSFTGPSLTNIDEFQIYSPHDFARSLEDYSTSAISLTTSPAVERGEFHVVRQPNLTTYNQAFESPDGMLTPATSDSSSTSAATAYSEPMTRSNTNDVLCSGFDMIRMDSMSRPEQLNESGLAKQAHDLFSFSSNMDTSEYHDFSLPVSVVDGFAHQQQFSYGSVEMKHSPSNESNTSSQSVVSVSQVQYDSNFSSQSTTQRQTQELRPLQPKQRSDSLTTSAISSSPALKLVEVTLEDGRKIQKAEIPRTIRQPQQRKTTFCPHCHDQPQGFHGEHELNRHIDRQHRSARKVWICKDVSGHGFLDGCKACRNNKTYGANYNAAAHLRRAHFNPCKNKRGGRGKKSEGRGGMGGGNKPSMEELKHWMYAMYEIIFDGKVVEMRPVPADGQEDVFAAQVVAVPAEMAYDGGMPEDFDFEYSPPAEQFVPDMQAGVMGYNMVPPAMQMPQQPYGQIGYMPIHNQGVYIQ